MKVVYIHHSGLFGGSSKSLGIVVQNLISKGVDAHIICPTGKVVDFFRQITPNVHVLTHRAFPLLMTITKQKGVYYHYFRNLLMIRNIHKVRALLQDIQPDIVHCNEWGLVLFARMASKMKIPVVMHARTMGDENHRLITKVAIKFINKYCDHFISITGSVDGFFGEVKTRSIIYNAIEKTPVPNRFKSDKKVINFLSLSALAVNKGVYEIVEAARLLKNNPRVNIQIAGKINTKNLKEVTFKERLLLFMGINAKDTSRAVLELIESNKLNNIQLLGHIDNLESVLISADVILAPMRLNAPPRTVFEGGMFEIPSILAMEDKVEDVVEDGYNGFLIDEEAPEQLVEAMLKYVNDPELRRRHGINARERYIVNHNIDNCVNQVLEVYQKVSSSPK